MVHFLHKVKKKAIMNIIMNESQFIIPSKNLTKTVGFFFNILYFKLDFPLKLINEYYMVIYCLENQAIFTQW